MLYILMRVVFYVLHFAITGNRGGVVGILEHEKLVLKQILITQI